MALKNLDRFKIKTELAKRLCYTMYEAEDERDGKLVLLKVLEEARAKDRHSTLHFLNGARVASLLDNPNICKIYHFGGDLGRYFIASEPVEYQPFRSIIKADFALSFEDLIEMFMRIGRALRYAHLQGAIHGLLNPDSIFINSSGDIKIDDFGFNWYIPQIFQRTDKEALQFVCYTSPELFQEGQYDGRVDIYSLGIILHNLINGAPPFNGGTLSRLQKSHLSNELPPLNLTEKGLPQELENIVQRAISLRDGIRFLNFKDFLDSMELLRRGHLELADAPLEPTAAEQLVLQKHFEDGEYKIDYSSKNRRAFSISPKKLAATGSALFILLIFFLVITNRLPLPFGEDDESGLVAEQLLQPAATSSGSDTLLANEMASTSSRPAEDSLLQAMSDSVVSTIAGSFVSPGKSSSEPESNSNHTLASKPTDLPSTDSAMPLNRLNSGAATEPPPTSSEPKRPATEPKPPAVTNTADKPAAASAPAKVLVMVHSRNQPVEAFVFIDNKLKGKTNAQGFFEIPGLVVNKTYKVKISKEGHATVNRSFTALEKTPVLNFDVSPKQEIYGTLILEVLPKADSIFVDGKLYKGKSPLQLSLPWGDHKVRFVNKELGSHQQSVNLKVGEVQRVKHNFAQSESGKIAVSLRNAAQYGFGYVYVDGKLWEGMPNTTPMELTLPVGSHTVELRRDGFDALPKDIIVTVEKDQTKYVAFTFTKN